MNDNGIRNDFSSVIVNTFKSVWALLIVGVLNVVSNFKDLETDTLFSTEGLIVLLALLALIIIIFVFTFLHWRKTYIVIDDDNLVINNNYFFNKKVTTVRLSSIATVNFQQGIPEKIFGTYKLQVDINSSVTADKTDFNLVFKKEKAEEVKALLTGKMMSSTSSAGTKVEENVEESKLIYQFTTGQVIRHCILSLSIMGLLLTVFVAACALIGSIMDESKKGLGAAGLISILIVAVPMLWSMLKPLFQYQNFRIEKIGERAVVSYGLFTHRQYNLPLDKTNAIVIHQPLFARMFGYYYGELINVGMGDEDNNGIPIFCLLVRKEELQAIVKELKPELQINGLGEASPMNAYFPTCVPYFIFGIIPPIVGFCFGAVWGILGLLVFVFFMLSALLSVKTKALAVLDDKAVITSGVFHKKTVIVPNKKIQNVDMKNGPISRRFHIAKGNACILAAALNREIEIGYFPEKRFDVLFDKIVF